MVKRQKNAGLELSIETRETVYGCQLGSLCECGNQSQLNYFIFLFRRLISALHEVRPKCLLIAVVR
jgi:hypothetical protein